MGQRKIFTFILIILIWTNHISASEKHKHHHESELQENWWENLVETSKLVSFYNDSSVDTWSIAGNVANYLQIPEIKKVTLPVLVNLIFIGFDGFGNQLFKLTEEQLEPWFGHIEHTLKHIIAPVGEEQTTISTFKTKDVPVEYRFHYNLVNLSPLFDTITQDYILWNTRPERPENDQKDFEEFAKQYNLDLEDTDYLLDDEDYYDLFDPKKLIDLDPTDDFEDEEEEDNEEEEEEEEYTKKKRYYVNADHVSSFLQAAIKALGLDDAYNIVILNPLPPVDKGEIYGYRVGFSDQELDVLFDVSNPNPGDLLQKLNSDMKPCNDNDGRGDDDVDVIPKILHPRFKEKNIQIVDYHLASDDFAQWYLKQQSSRSNLFNSSATNPDDPSFIFNVAYGDYKSIFDLAKRIIESGTEMEKNYLYDIIMGKDYIDENCLVESWISNSRMAFFDISAGPFTWGPLIASEGSKTEQTLPKIPKYRKPIEYSASTSIEVEREHHTLSSYYALHCINPTAPDVIKFCDEIVRLMKENREKFSRTAIEGDIEEGEGVDMEVEMFLSRLSAVLSHTIREVIVPPTSLFDNPFSVRVTFQIYFISTHDDYETRGKDAFDYEEFKKEVLQLKFPNQEFLFSLKEIKMKDSVELATAFYSSQHSTVIPTLSTSGYFYSEGTTYIDSKQLRDHLLSIRSFQSPPNRETSTRREREIPIFIFSVNSPSPLFIDKYYESKTLNDVIIAVQNSQYHHRSRYSCNQRQIYLNLRNPLKSILSSVAMSVGGLIPTHISYNTAHSNAIQSWLWSVGNSPLSQTSSGHRFNEFQIDIAKRNQIVNSMAKSIDIFNRGVVRLSHLLTNMNNRGVDEVLPLQKLKDLYFDSVEILNSISANVAILDFKRAAQLIILLEYTVLEFETLSIYSDSLFDVYECLPVLVANTDSDTKIMLLIPILFIVLNISFIVLILLCRGRGVRKEKIN